jgi:hypothetical protein
LGEERNETEVVVEVADAAPREEVSRIVESLGKLFPGKRKPGRTLRVALDWSEEREAWTVRSADQHIADVAWTDRTRDVAEALKAVGHAVEVEPKPDRDR